MTVRGSAALVAGLSIGLACAADEEGLQTRAVCGDGVVVAHEVCDRDRLQDMDCADFGYPGGRLACADTCDGFVVQSCTGIPSFRDRGEDPCGSCGPDEVCRGLECVSACGADPAGSIPYTLEAWPVGVRVEAAGLPAAARMGELVVEAVDVGRVSRVSLDLTIRDEAILELEDGGYRAFWIPTDPAAFAVELASFEVAGPREVRWQPVLHRVDVVLGSGSTGPLVPGRLDWSRADGAATVPGRASATAVPLVAAPDGAQQTVWGPSGRYRLAYRGVGLDPAFGPPSPERGVVTPALVVQGDLQWAGRLEHHLVELDVSLDDGPLPDRVRATLGLVSATDTPSDAVPVLTDGSGPTAMLLEPGVYAPVLWGAWRGPQFVVPEVEVAQWRPGLVKLSGTVIDPPEDLASEMQLVLHLEQEGELRPLPALDVIGGRYEGYVPDQPLWAALAATRNGVRVLRMLGDEARPPSELAAARWGPEVTLQGRVTLAGAPWPGEEARVRVISPRGPGGTVAVAAVAEDGNFEARVPPGRHELWLEGGQGQDRLPSGSYLLHPGVEVDESAPPQTFDARVEWITVSLEGERVAGAIVQLQPYLGSVAGVRPALTEQVIQRAVATDGSEVRLPVWPGRYRARLAVPGHRFLAELLDAERTVVADGPQRLSWDLAVRTARVIREGGRAPAAGARVIYRAPLWEVATPLVDGAAELDLRPAAYRVLIEEPTADGALRRYVVQPGCR